MVSDPGGHVSVCVHVGRSIVSVKEHHGIPLEGQGGGGVIEQVAKTRASLRTCAGANGGPGTRGLAGGDVGATESVARVAGHGALRARGADRARHGAVAGCHQRGARCGCDVSLRMVGLGEHTGRGGITGGWRMVIENQKRWMLAAPGQVGVAALQAPVVKQVSDAEPVRV